MRFLLSAIILGILTLGISFSKARSVSQAVSTPSYCMPAPPGYSHLLFEDNFAGKTLDTTKWSTQMGDAHYFPWNNSGKLPNPYSAVGNVGGGWKGNPQYNAEYGNPNQVTVNNGLILSARRDNSMPGYSWKAGYICTEGKFKFQGGYVQIRAKLPDSATGAWAGFWFLDGGAEIDLNESGFTALGKNIVNRVIASHMQSPGNKQQYFDTGMDLSADYHILYLLTSQERREERRTNESRT